MKTFKRSFHHISFKGLWLALLQIKYLGKTSKILKGLKPLLQSSHFIVTISSPTLCTFIHPPGNKNFIYVPIPKLHFFDSSTFSRISMIRCSNCIMYPHLQEENLNKIGTIIGSCFKMKRWTEDDCSSCTSLSTRLYYICTYISMNGCLHRLALPCFNV